MVALESDKFWRQGRLFVESGSLFLKDTTHSSADPPEVFSVSGTDEAFFKQGQPLIRSVSKQVNVESGQYIINNCVEVLA